MEFDENDSGDIGKSLTPSLSLITQSLHSIFISIHGHLLSHPPLLTTSTSSPDIMELKRMMEKLGQAKTHLELKKMIAEVDTNNSGA